MKKLNIKSFWIILCGLISSLICKVADTIQSRNSGFERLAKRRNISAEKLAILQRVAFYFNIFITIIHAIIIAYFVIKLVKNKNKAVTQGYINFLYVVCIIFSVLNGLSAVFGNWIALINLAVNIIIIAGCKMQKKQPCDITILHN